MPETATLDVIVMYNLTRFYRSPPGQIAMALELLRKIKDEYNVLVDFAREPEIEDPSLAGLWRFLKSWVTAYGRLQISLRTRYGSLRIKREGRLYHKPSLIYCCAAWFYNKEVGQVMREEYETPKKQLVSIIRKYWEKPCNKEDKNTRNTSQ